MIKSWGLSAVLGMVFCGTAFAQRIDLPANLPQSHPWISTVTRASHAEILQRIRTLKHRMAHAKAEAAPFKFNEYRYYLYQQYERRQQRAFDI